MSANILLLDDRDDTLLPKGLLVDRVDPREGSTWTELEQRISDYELIMLDQNLEMPDALSTQASDGASLVSHFRAWERSRRTALPPLVLLTNEAEAYAGEVPIVGPQVPIDGNFLGREHRIAPRLDVEWILFKQDDRLEVKVSSLVTGYRRAREVVGPNGASMDEIAEILRVPDAVWSERVKDALPRSRPPVSQEKDAKPTNPPRGPSMIIRWLLHRILPYPGLLVSDLYAAWTLNVTVSSFVSSMDREGGPQWIQDLKAAEYKGALSDFLGRRWWTAGVENSFWDLSQGTDHAGGLQQALDQLSGDRKLEVIPTPDPVVVWTEDLREGGVETMESAVQVHPPGWPAEAYEPWLAKADVEGDPVLAAMAEGSSHLSVN